jgi:polysaccharide chain length determinant protein (PEP-CTERM system associated)
MLGHRALNVEDYLTVLKRRWWIIAIPAVIIPIVAIGATYFVTPEYVSSTLVLIDQQKIPGEFVKPLQGEALDSRLAYETEQIESRSSIEPIITKYNLYGDQHLPMDVRVDQTRKALKIQAIESEIARSNGLPGFKIAFTANDPHTAQQVCSDVTSLFTANNLKIRAGAAEQTNDFLQSQLNDAKRNLDDQDAKEAAFELQHFGTLPGDTGNNVSVMSSLNSRLDATTQAIQALQQNRSVGEALLAQQTVAVSPSGPASVAPQTQETQLEALEAQKADLLSRYTADYPEVRSVNHKIEDLRAEMAKAASAPPPVVAPTTAPSPRDSANVVQLRAGLRGIDVQIATKQKEQDDLKRQIQGYEGRIQSTPGVEAEFKALTRDHDTALGFYNSLREKMNQSQMTTSLERHQEGETFTVLDAASLPTEPTYPKQINFAVGGLAGGIAIGVLIVAFVEYKDIALRTERDVWELTHLPTLAVIAWSGEVATAKESSGSRIRRLFSRKPSKEALADA